MIEQGLATFLKGDTKLVGPLVTAGGIYPEKFPQFPKAPPPGWAAVSFQRSTTERIRSLTGPSGLTHTTISIVCWGLVYGTAKTLADAVRKSDGGLGLTRSFAPGNPPNVLDGYQGPMGTFKVQSCMLDDDVDSDIPPQRKDDLAYFLTSIEASLWWEES